MFFSVLFGTFLGNIVYSQVVSRNIDKKVEEVIKKRWLE